MPERQIKEYLLYSFKRVERPYSCLDSEAISRSPLSCQIDSDCTLMIARTTSNVVTVQLTKQS